MTAMNVTKSLSLLFFLLGSFIILSEVVAAPADITTTPKKSIAFNSDVSLLISTSQDQRSLLNDDLRSRMLAHIESYFPSNQTFGKISGYLTPMSLRLTPKENSPDLWVELPEIRVRLVPELEGITSDVALSTNFRLAYPYLGKQEFENTYKEGSQAFMDFDAKCKALTFNRPRPKSKLSCEVAIPSMKLRTSTPPNPYIDSKKSTLKSESWESNVDFNLVFSHRVVVGRNYLDDTSPVLTGMSYSCIIESNPEISFENFYADFERCIDKATEDSEITTPSGSFSMIHVLIDQLLASLVSQRAP